MFPPNRPTKEITVFLRTFMHKQGISVKTKAHECMPFFIHKVVDNEHNGEIEWGRQYVLTHLFSGYGIGVQGSYEYVMNVANDLLVYPIFYCPSSELMKQHDMYNKISDIIAQIKNKHRKKKFIIPLDK